jgi:hypothetical protein
VVVAGDAQRLPGVRFGVAQRSLAKAEQCAQEPGDGQSPDRPEPLRLGGQPGDPPPGKREVVDHDQRVERGPVQRRVWRLPDDQVTAAQCPASPVGHQ